MIHSVAEAAGQLGNLDPLPLLLAALCAPIVPATTAAAWRSVLASQGVRVSMRDGWLCYGLGSVANTFLPARVGDALRIELFARRVHRAQPRWLGCGVAASVGLAQSLVFACVLGCGWVAGALPVWTVVPALVCPAVAWRVGKAAVRRRPRGRIAFLATASALSGGAWTRLVAWIAAGTCARVLAVAATLAAVSAPHPLATALVAICGLGAGRLVPFAPGVAGVPAAVMTVAVAHAGVSASTAVAAAVCFHGLETAAAIAVPLAGWSSGALSVVAVWLTQRYAPSGRPATLGW